MATKKKFRKEKYIKNRYSERTGKWTFQVFIDYYDYDNQPQTYTKSFSEKEYYTPGEAMNAACAHRDQIRNRINTSSMIKRGVTTLNDIFEASKELFPRKKETIKQKIKLYNQNIKETYGSKPVSKITSYDIQMSLNTLIESSSDNKIGKVFTLWSFLMQTARIKKLIRVNPIEEVIRPKSSKIRIRKDVHTDKNTLEKVINALRNHTKNSSEHLFNCEIIIYALRVIYYTGMRPAECFALHKNSVDFKKNIIKINDEIGSSLTEYNVIRETKTDLSKRTVPIFKELKIILEELVNYQEDDYLFATADGKLFDVDVATNKIYRVCKLEGIQFNMYRLRHLFSTDLITNNTDPRTVMELMGHNNIGMTIEYARSNSDLKAQAIEERKLS